MAVRKNREYRNFPLRLEVRAGEADETFRVTGYAATYEPYVLWKDSDAEYREQIAPDAFDGADMSDVIFLYNHQGMVYARKKNGTLQVAADSRGLKVDADLSTTEAARQMYESIRTGLIDQMSFAFTVREDSYDRETRTRTIRKVEKVYDVSAVSNPANPETDISAVSARNWLHGVMEAEKAERLGRESRLALANAIYHYKSI